MVTGLFTITGAFATGRDFTLVPRFLYWLVIVAVAAASFHLAVHWCLRGGLYALRERALRVAAGAFFGSFAPAAMIVLMERITRPQSGSEAWFIWLTAWFIGTVVCFMRFMPPTWQVARLEESRTVEPQRIPFLLRLPAEVGYELISISAEDHYLRVVTRDTTSMIKLPFSTAMAELRHYPGERIHRSHWVATASVRSLDKTGRGHVLRLDTGETLPVSATYLDRAQTMMEAARQG